MGSWFYLTLDTTPPQIQIDTPLRSIPLNVIEIIIKSNEKLSKYQEIYIIDSVGNRHDYTFLWNEDEFIGYVDLHEYPIGITTIYATVKDEVDNISSLTRATLYVGYLQDKFDAYMKVESRNAKITVTSRDIPITARSRHVQIKIS